MFTVFYELGENYKGFTYRIDKDHITICGFIDRFVEELTVPGFIHGMFVTHLDTGAFKEFINLKSVYLPSSIKTLGESVFQNCISLKDMKLPDEIVEVGAYAFSNCPEILDISFPKKLKFIGEFGFQGTGVTELDLPDSIISIENGAFSECEFLQRVKLPKYLKVLSAEVFANCPRLSSVLLPKGLVSIGYRAFAGCEKLFEIDIPKSVEELIHYSFEDCKNLEKCALRNPYTTFDPETFYDCDRLTIYVSECSTDLYGISYRDIAEFTIDSSKIADIIQYSEDYRINEHFKYKIENSKVIILKHKGPQMEIVKIPDYIQEMPVHEIAPNVFIESMIIGVVLPKFIKKIDYQSFAYCCALNRIYVANDVEFNHDIIYMCGAFTEFIYRDYSKQFRR